MYFYLMKLVVIPKNKKQEKALRNFLEESAIDFTIAAEDAAIYKTTHSKKVATKQTASSSEKSPADVPEWQKQFVRKSIKKYNTHPELLIFPHSSCHSTYHSDSSLVQRAAKRSRHPF